MKTDKTPVEAIDHLISEVGESDRNMLSGLFLDETLMEFFLLKNEITLPAIPVGELDYRNGMEITRALVKYIPEYIKEHKILEKRKPTSEQHSLHFVKMLPGKIIDFVHILRFDFKLTGSNGRITGKGDTGTFPEYSTERIKYKSRLVPVAKGSDPLLLDSVRLKSRLEVDTDGKRFTSVFFDEFSTAEISIDFSVKTGGELFSISPKIYPFISYDYFTACMNIPDPGNANLETGVILFEPLFFYLYFLYREREHEFGREQLSVFSDYLEVSEAGIIRKPLLQKLLKDFFSRYTLFRDDEMMLAGIRQIRISG